MVFLLGGKPALQMPCRGTSEHARERGEARSRVLNYWNELGRDPG
jgi:hypothetical protein